MKLLARSRARMYAISSSRAARTGLAAALCVLLAALPVAPQQPTAGASVPKAIKATSVVVNVYAIAEGRRGHLIRDLTKDEFELTDDGVPQTIDFFSQDTNTSLSLGIAIDTSASQSQLLGTEQAAAKKFLRSVLQSQDQAFVMNFDVDVKLLKDFTGAPAELAQAIDSAEINSTGRSVLADNSVRATGGTHLFDAVYLASNELMKTRVGRKVLVLVTDGEDQGSRTSLPGSIESAEKADVIVYSIVVSDPEFYSLMGSTYHGSASVRKLARETGGSTIRVKTADEIGQAFDQIARELRSQYRLGYSPTDLRHDGSFRRLQVKVRAHNYTVRTRAGYYDQTDERAGTTNSHR